MSVFTGICRQSAERTLETLRRAQSGGTQSVPIETVIGVYETLLELVESIESRDERIEMLRQIIAGGVIH